MKKKVLILANPDSIHTKKWVDGWKILGYSCVVSGLSPNKFNIKLIFNAKINVNGGNGKEYLKKIFTFKRILKNENPSIINAHYMTSYGLIASLIKRRKDTLVTFLPGTDVMKTMDKNFIYILMAKFIFARSDLLISVSNTMTKKILKNFPYLKNKIMTQQYGVDTDFLDQFTTTKKDIDILTNRGWVKNSNYEILLNIFNRFSNHTKAIIGYNGTRYAKRLKVGYPSLNDCIYDVMAYNNNISLVSRCKIFISLTTSDGTPLSLLEAMYLGAIPIVSDLQTNREVIDDEKNGFIVSIEDDELYKKINYILSLSEEELNDMREINKKLINKKFHMKDNFQNMNRFILKIKNAK